MPTPSTRRGSAPATVLVCVPELTTLTGGRQPNSYRRYATGVWSCYSRRRGRTWSADREPVFSEPGTFWQMVEQLTKGGNCLTILAPIGTHLLTATGFWGQVDDGRFKLEVRLKVPGPAGRSRGRRVRVWEGKTCLRPRPTIVTARTNAGSIKVLSALNYADVHPQKLVQLFGLESELTEPWDGLGNPPPVDARTECWALSKWYRQILTRWLDADLGPWADTAANVSVSVWRALDGRSAVRRHHDTDALALESRACHGGRATVWYYGVVGDRSTCPPWPGDPPPDAGVPRIPGQAHKLDFASQYPSILGREWFPVSLMSVMDRCTPDELADLLRHWGAVAKVRLRPGAGEYPYRTKSRTLYPVGPFTTVLAGPELIPALRRGEVVSVGAVALYRMGRPFKKWSEYVLRQRMSAKRSGDRTGESLWKLVANAFGGKFAQNRRRWVRKRGEVSPVVWGEYPYRASADAPVVRRRALSGIPHAHEIVTAVPRFPRAIYTYLTAYGRRAMLDTRDSLPPKTVVAQDTDGLWVTDEGLSAARRSGLIGDGSPGTLRHVESVGYWRAWDARHYYAGGRWTVAGVASGWSLSDTATAEQGVITEPSQVMMDPRACLLFESVSTVRLDAIRPGVPVGADGWAGDYDRSGQPWRTA